MNTGIVIGLVVIVFMLGLCGYMGMKIFQQKRK